MLRPPAIVLTAALVICLGLLGSGTASAVVRNGGSGSDKLRGTNANDTLRGRGGNDRLYGLTGDDLVVGGPGADTVKGGQGVDDLGGGTGDDRINAGFDNVMDRTYGGPGDDVFFVFGPDEVSAGDGDDRVVAAYPDPTMFIQCGQGTDEVVFNQSPPSGVVSDDCEDVHVESAG